MTTTDSLWKDMAVFSIVIILTLTAYIKWSYSHWSRMGLKYVEPKFPFGNFWGTARTKITLGKELECHYLHMKSKGVKHAGLYFFHVPVYLPIDPEIVKHIMQVDFSNFVDRATYTNVKYDPLSEHLITMEGKKWRNMRIIVSRAFTPSKMKTIFPFMIKKYERLVDVVDSHLPEEPMEFKELFRRLTTDIVINWSFGTDTNGGSETEFEIQGKKFFNDSLLGKIKRLTCIFYPNVMRCLGVRFTPKSTEYFFMGVVRNVIKYREEHNVKRNDFMQLLINLKNDVSEHKSETTLPKNEITEKEIAGIAFGLFTAAYETTSTTLSLCLYEVSQNEAIQEKMRHEICTVLSRHNYEFTYEAMLEMNYMENVINETLRKYPPIPVSTRRCNGNSKIPNTNLNLKKGDIILIPIEPLQHDPEYYPNPEVFDPNRFTEENKQNRHPFTFLPFGEGPRLCIGFRFAMMQIKVGLTFLLKNYTFKLNSKTQIPLVLDPNAMFNSIAGEVWLNIEKTKQIHN